MYVPYVDKLIHIGVDLSIIRKGPTLSTQARRALITPITLREIDYAMWSIDGDKAPGLDGIDATFFKHMWHVIKSDIYVAI